MVPAGVFSLDKAAHGGEMKGAGEAVDGLEVLEPCWAAGGHFGLAYRVCCRGDVRGGGGGGGGDGVGGREES